MEQHLTDCLALSLILLLNLLPKNFCVCKDALLQVQATGCGEGNLLIGQTHQKTQSPLKTQSLLDFQKSTIKIASGAC